MDSDDIKRKLGIEEEGKFRIDPETGNVQKDSLLGWGNTGKKLDKESGRIREAGLIFDSNTDTFVDKETGEFKKDDLIGSSKSGVRINPETGVIEKEGFFGWTETDERIHPDTGEVEKKGFFGWSEVKERGSQKPPQQARAPEQKSDDVSNDLGNLIGWLLMVGLIIWLAIKALVITLMLVPVWVGVALFGAVCGYVTACIAAKRLSEEELNRLGVHEEHKKSGSFLRLDSASVEGSLRFYPHTLAILGGALLLGAGMVYWPWVVSETIFNKIILAAGVVGGAYLATRLGLLVMRRQFENTVMARAKLQRGKRSVLPLVTLWVSVAGVCLLVASWVQPLTQNDQAWDIAGKVGFGKEKPIEIGESSHKSMAKVQAEPANSELIADGKNEKSLIKNEEQALLIVRGKTLSENFFTGMWVGEGWYVLDNMDLMSAPDPEPEVAQKIKIGERADALEFLILCRPVSSKLVAVEPWMERRGMRNEEPVEVLYYAGDGVFAIRRNSGVISVPIACVTDGDMLLNQGMDQELWVRLKCQDGREGWTNNFSNLAFQSKHGHASESDVRQAVFGQLVESLQVVWGNPSFSEKRANIIQVLRDWESEPISDRDWRIRSTGYWRSPQHDYVYRADGTWQMLGGTTAGLWAIEQGKFMVGNKTYSVLALTDEQLIYQETDGSRSYLMTRITPEEAKQIWGAIHSTASDFDADFISSLPNMKDDPSVEGVNPTFSGERFPETRTDELSVEKLRSMSLDDLQFAINEMFARHGAYFPNDDTRRQFEKFEWYRPQMGVDFDQIEARFTAIERENLKLMGAERNHKREMGSTQSNSKLPANVIEAEKPVEKPVLSWPDGVYERTDVFDNAKDRDTITTRITVKGDQFEFRNTTVSNLKPGARPWTNKDLRNVRQCSSVNLSVGTIIRRGQDTFQIRINSTRQISDSPKGWSGGAKSLKWRKWTFKKTADGGLVDIENASRVWKRVDSE